MTTLTTTLTITMGDKGPIYTYNPNSQTVTEPNTTLVYELDNPTIRAGWLITGLTITNDTQSQASDIVEGPGGTSISFVDSCTKVETFDVTVYAANTTMGHKVSIDPQVHNVPT